MSTEIRGVVTRATGSWYDVLHEGRTIACRIRGRIRLKGVRSTNPVVVGDEVVCTEGGDGEWVIERILPRRNYIIRRASNLSKESHIIAANIDQALLVATLSQPVTAPEFLDRFLATCEAYKIPATILLAKYDLAAADPEAAAAFHATYESAGYRVVDLSTLDGTGLLLTGSNMSGKTTFIRTVMLNALLGETLCTCFAERFTAPYMRLHSSIRISDDITEGTSYYLQEVLTVKRLLEDADRPAACLFVLDELFKGTNTTERIAAGKAVLARLNRGPHIVLAATHDIELAELLRGDGYELHHFREEVADGRLVFDYCLHTGPLTTRNAIRILELYDYPPELIAEAYDTQQKLLGKG